MHFGRDILSAPDVDLEDLLNALAPSEIDSLVNEMAADPDDKHLPASVRTAYHCKKQATGPLNRDSLITFINDEGINTPEKEEAVKYEAGVKRGKVYIPKYDEATLALMKRKEEVAAAVRLDDDEEAALSEANCAGSYDFGRDFGFKPTRVHHGSLCRSTQEAINHVVDNKKECKEVCLNNIAGIDEKDFCDLFDGLRQNCSLVKLSAVNCEINDFAIATLSLAIENNNTLKSINLESNRITPDTLASLFEAIASTTNGVLEIHVSNQAQSNMGYRVESRIADAICKNNSLLKVGIKFQFAEVINRVEKHLISNLDRLRKERAKNKH
ncbi:TMOD [Lepeophtheirus salmonis]|uniref:TMOD n=1 Tax=Lepeophtheirus salmonis TaxID=72036 RepID=A0A7R8CIB1_LEPSM|nr:TMOD [Lepeophtheirus salmonis]CAF2830634.1 TMOD [Lepeophtheirus salmonis]